jgi:ubiquinone/menaquinone biosynthesis C-methylase UbiE
VKGDLLQNLFPLSRLREFDRIADMKEEIYVHCYSTTESQRLTDQAETLNNLLHRDSLFYPAGLVLEAGCGTGTQTTIIALKNPECNFISIDISDTSLAKAEKNTEKHKIRNVKFQSANVYSLPFEDESFDHVFVCFLLEHLRGPAQALTSLKRVLKKGGTITVIEGDHGSAYYYPRSASAQATIQCLIDIQASLGGNSLIGRELYPLLVSANFEHVSVSPRVVYADANRPEMVEGFSRNTFIAMVAGAKEQAIRRGMITETDWEKGIADLERSAGIESTFSYTFFKGFGRKSATYAGLVLIALYF